MPCPPCLLCFLHQTQPPCQRCYLHLRSHHPSSELPPLPPLAPFVSVPHDRFRPRGWRWEERPSLVVLLLQSEWGGGGWGESLRPNLFTSLCFVIMKEEGRPRKIRASCYCTLILFLHLIVLRLAGGGGGGTGSPRTALWENSQGLNSRSEEERWQW